MSALLLLLGAQQVSRSHRGAPAFWEGWAEWGGVPDGGAKPIWPLLGNNFDSLKFQYKDSMVPGHKDAAETKTGEPNLPSLSLQSPSLALAWLRLNAGPEPGGLDGWTSVQAWGPALQWWMWPKHQQARLGGLMSHSGIRVV